MVLNVHRNNRLIRGKGEGGRGNVVGGREIIFYIDYRYTVNVITRMTPALRWAAMRVIVMFHNCEEQSQETVSTDHNF